VIEDQDGYEVPVAVLAESIDVADCMASDGWRLDPSYTGRPAGVTAWVKQVPNLFGMREKNATVTYLMDVVGYEEE
jgi:hypothetical protein